MSSQYFTFLLVVIATGCWAVARKKKTTESTTISSSHRTSNYRIVIVSAISFFLGLQFSHLRDLLRADFTVGGPNDDDATEYMTWVPDELEYLARRNERERGVRQRQKPQRNNPFDHSTKKEITKKKVKPLPRYHDSNYTDFKPLPWSLPKPSPIRYQTSEEFMKDYIALKREKNIPLPWEQTEKYKDNKVTLPRPIIGLNFPKSGTLTMSEYFNCAGIVSIHTHTNDGRIGICMMENHLTDKPPMEGCNTHQLKRKKKGEPKPEAKPTEVIFDIGLQGPPCYYASLHDGGLENIAKHYPEGTIMLVTRNPKKWYHSFESWGSILKRWGERCGFDGSLDGVGMEYWADLHHSSERERYWVEFYEAHTQKIREFAMKHLSLTYVEVELEDDKMAEQLEYYTGVEQKCVQVCHPGPQWIRKHDTTSKCHPVGDEPPEIESDDGVYDDDNGRA
ncbi:hypothetical protein ACHAWC_010895 [Mediolabrus comicus]